MNFLFSCSYVNRQVLTSGDINNINIDDGDDDEVEKDHDKIDETDWWNIFFPALNV